MKTHFIRKVDKKYKQPDRTSCGRHPYHKPKSTDNFKEVTCFNCIQKLDHDERYWHMINNRDFSFWTGVGHLWYDRPGEYEKLFGRKLIN